jgi:[ribosomal protein S5]-alanine N-acetyltransferase
VDFRVPFFVLKNILFIEGGMGMDYTFPIIVSKNLFFRPFQPSDAQDVLRLFSDADTMMLDGGDTLNDISQAYDFIQTYSKYVPGTTAIRWAVVLRSDQRFLGSCGFHKIDYYHKRAEMGGELLKFYQQRGLATEAMFQLIHFGFFSMNMNRLTAMVSPKNEKAISLVEKGPFKKEGCLREWEQWRGEPVDLNVYGLLKREWIEITGIGK